MSDQLPGTALRVLPAKVRQYLYLGYAAAGCTLTGLLAADVTGPKPLAVLGAFSPLFGGVAASNVRSTVRTRRRRRKAANVLEQTDHPADYDPGPSDVDSQIDRSR